MAVLTVRKARHDVNRVSHTARGSQVTVNALIWRTTVNIITMTLNTLKRAVHSLKWKEAH